MLAEEGHKGNMLSILDRRRSAPCFLVIANSKSKSAFLLKTPTVKNTSSTKLYISPTTKTLI